MQFLDDGGGVFRNVLGAATAVPRGTPESGHRYVIGVDWGRVDFSCAVVIDASSNRMVAIDRFNGISRWQRMQEEIFDGENSVMKQLAASHDVEIITPSPGRRDDP